MIHLTSNETTNLKGKDIAHNEEKGFMSAK